MQRAWSNTGTMHLPPLSTGAKTPVSRLWDSPQTFMGYNERPGIGLVKIWQINSRYYTSINESIPISIVDTLIPLAGKVALATKTCRGKGGPTRTRTCTCAHTHTHATFHVLRSLAQRFKKAWLTDPPTLPSPSQAWHRIGEDLENKIALSHQHK